MYKHKFLLPSESDALYELHSRWYDARMLGHREFTMPVDVFWQAALYADLWRQLEMDDAGNVIGTSYKGLSVRIQPDPVEKAPDKSPSEAAGNVEFGPQDAQGKPPGTDPSNPAINPYTQTASDGSMAPPKSPENMAAPPVDPVSIDPTNPIVSAHTGEPVKPEDVVTNPLTGGKETKEVIVNPITGKPVGPA